jgi:hypothetical protein
MRQPAPIEFKKSNDGSCTLKIRTLMRDKEPITEAIQSLARDCQDNAYAVLDRIRESEELEEAEILEADIEKEEIIRVEVKAEITRIRRRTPRDHD